MRWTRWDVLDLEVVDVHGVHVGLVVDTWPFDGGEAKLLVVRLASAFGERKMVEVSDVWWDGAGLRLPFARWQVEDSPSLTTGRHAADDPYRARGYWRFTDPLPIVA